MKAEVALLSMRTSSEGVLRKLFEGRRSAAQNGSSSSSSSSGPMARWTVAL